MYLTQTHVEYLICKVLLFKTAVYIRVQYVQCTVFAEECNAAAYMIIRLLLVIYKTNDQIIATPRGCAYY